MSLDSSLRCASFRMTGGGMAAFGMTGEEGLCSGWQKLASVILSEGRNLRSENGVCAMSLDSSLRCAAFRMTGERGRCVENDRGERALRSE